MRRRNWIVAAGAAGVAAAGAAYTSRGFIRSLQSGCGFPPPAPPPQRNVTVSKTAFYSRILKAQVGIVIIDAQPEVSTADRLLIFALPGRDGAAAAHAAGLHLADYLGAAVRRHGLGGARMILADSGSSYWHARRGGEDRMAMLIQEIVLPAISHTHAKRRNVAIIGWSMGAYGAFLAAEKYPELFGSVCGVSVAMWRSAREQLSAVPDAFDDARDFDRNDLRRGSFNLKNTRVRLACGEGDPFFPADQEFAEKLRDAGVGPQIAFSPGCHDDNFWQRSAPQDFAFLLGA
jgi:hypothetical protein